MCTKLPCLIFVPTFCSGATVPKRSLRDIGGGCLSLVVGNLLFPPADLAGINGMLRSKEPQRALGTIATGRVGFLSLVADKLLFRPGFTGNCLPACRPLPSPCPVTMRTKLPCLIFVPTFCSSATVPKRSLRDIVTGGGGCLSLVVGNLLFPPADLAGINGMLRSKEPQRALGTIVTGRVGFLSLVADKLLFRTGFTGNCLPACRPLPSPCPVTMRTKLPCLIFVATFCSGATVPKRSLRDIATGRVGFLSLVADKLLFRPGFPGNCLPACRSSLTGKSAVDLFLPEKTADNLLAAGTCLLAAGTCVATVGFIEMEDTVTAVGRRMALAELFEENGPAAVTNTCNCTGNVT